MKTCVHVAAVALLTGMVGHAFSVHAAGYPSTSILSAGASAPSTLGRMLRPMTGEFRGQRLEDAIKYIAEMTGAELEPLWFDEENATGMDRERSITLSFRGITAQQLLERVLEKASEDSPAGSCTWQLSASGAVQIGPRGRLNAYKRLEIYDVRDLLREVPDFTNAPQLDLQSALQSHAGGGGGSVFRETSQAAPGAGPGGIEAPTLERRGERLRKLLVDLVEPDQWLDRGGDGGTIVFYQGTLIVNAPDYLQRQIGGYRFGPAHPAPMDGAGGESR